MIGREHAESDVQRPTDLAKHSLVVTGHRTSISLERAFWDALRKIAEERQSSLAALVAAVDAERGGANLSSALRVFVLSALSQIKTPPQ